MPIKKWVLIGLSVIISVVSGTIIYLLNSHPDLKPYQPRFVQPTAVSLKSEHLSATFLGTSTILVSDGNTSILIDGFFTRPSLSTLLMGRIMPDRELIANALKKIDVSNLAAVIPVHSHYDHAMDAPEVARMTGALLVGSESTANIGRGWGLPESQIRIVKSIEPLVFGAFEVRLIPSKHSPVPSWRKHRIGIGEKISEPLQFPAAVSAFKEGKTYSVFIRHKLGNVLIQASAGFVEGALKDYQADVIFLGIGGIENQSKEFQESYFRETVTAVGASRVIPVHWDDFMQPLTQPLAPFNRLLSDFKEQMLFLDRMTSRYPSINIIMLSGFAEIKLYGSD